MHIAMGVRGRSKMNTPSHSDWRLRSSRGLHIDTGASLWRVVGGRCDLRLKMLEATNATAVIRLTARHDRLRPQWLVVASCSRMTN